VEGKHHRAAETRRYIDKMIKSPKWEGDDPRYAAYRGCPKWHDLPFLDFKASRLHSTRARRDRRSRARHSHVSYAISYRRLCVHGTPQLRMSILETRSPSVPHSISDPQKTNRERGFSTTMRFVLFGAPAQVAFMIFSKLLC
jgi:hypothetical protein